MIFSVPSLYLATVVFESVTNSYIRRREFAQKRYNKLGRDLEPQQPQTQYPTTNGNQIVPIPKQIFEKKIIDDYIDDFELQGYLFQETSKSNKKNEIENNDYDYFPEDIQYTRLRKRNFKTNENGKKKFTEWEETCYVCHDYGKLICCEECKNVSHLECSKLNVIYC